MKNITSTDEKINVRRYLSLKRYSHSLQVARLTERLCRQYNVEPHKGYTAGLMHDIAREMPDEELIKLTSLDGETIEPWESERPVLLHGRAGAVLLKKDFGIRDDLILEAVRVHVTGKPGMSLLSKIVFIADFLEPTRNIIDLKMEREIINLPIDLSVVRVLEMIFDYLKSERKPIAPPAIALYEELASVKFS